MNLVNFMHELRVEQIFPQITLNFDAERWVEHNFNGEEVPVVEKSQIGHVPVFLLYTMKQFTMALHVHVLLHVVKLIMHEKTPNVRLPITINRKDNVEFKW